MRTGDSFIAVQVDGCSKRRIFLYGHDAEAVAALHVEDIYDGEVTDGDETEAISYAWRFGRISHGTGVYTLHPELPKCGDDNATAHEWSGNSERSTCAKCRLVRKTAFVQHVGTGLHYNWIQYGRS